MTEKNDNFEKRQLLTIISRETIKPSSPTPTHLRTLKPSMIDKIITRCHIPVVYFYPKNDKTTNQEKAQALKQSLSQILTFYYPMAGKLSAPYIVCNDDGVAFVEASIDCRLNDLARRAHQDEIVDLLVPDGLGLSRSGAPSLLAVQLNHFTCGGLAVVLSISHQAADGVTMANFVNHWATVTRCGSVDPSINTHIIHDHPTPRIIIPDFKVENTNHSTIKRFFFPNSKLSSLKRKVIEMSKNTINPTRVEILASLLFKFLVQAAEEKSSSLRPSNMVFSVNMRKKMVESLPDTTVGNIFTGVIVEASNANEIELCKVIPKLQKGKLALDKVRDVQETGELLATKLLSLQVGSSIYWITSWCWFPLYEADFGWGKPVDVTVRLAPLHGSGVWLMDTPSKEGILALVNVDDEELSIFEKNKELREFCDSSYLI